MSELIFSRFRELNRGTDRISAVYLLIKNGTCVYVGMSVNLRQRLSGHEHKGKYDRVLFKRFEPFALRIAEKVFIDIFQPELNTVGTVDRVALKEVQKDVARSSLSLALEKVGGPAKLAKALGISRQSVYAWKVCPAKRAEEVSKLSGVSKEMLRPDVFE